MQKDHRKNPVVFFFEGSVTMVFIHIRFFMAEVRLNEAAKKPRALQR